MSDIAVTCFLVFCVSAFLWRLATVTGLLGSGTEYAPKSLMTANEREFFGRLVRAHDSGYVFAQVAMSGLLEPRSGTGRARLNAYRKISQKRIDYTLHASDLSLLCVVELDDRTHHPASDRERDAMLRSAGIKTLRFNSSGKPSVAQLRMTIAATTGPSSSRGH